MSAQTTLVSAWAEQARTRWKPAVLRALASVRRTPIWVIALLWFTVGNWLGLWVASAVLSLPVVAGPAGALAAPQGMIATAEAASVAGPMVQREGSLVVLTWRVSNTGERDWDVPSYRFIPDRPDLPVVPLPRSVPAKETVTIVLTLTAPEGKTEWRPGWSLTGPRGPISGGELEVRISLAGM